MNGPIRRLAIGLFVAFGALLLSVTWLQVVRADELKLDARNPRPALTVRGKERGIIVTADGTVVARSVQEENSREFIRQYPEGETFAHVVGYSSFLVGESGLEAAYSQQLRSRRDLTISDIIAVVFGADLAPPEPGDHCRRQTATGCGRSARGLHRGRRRPRHTDRGGAHRLLQPRIRPRPAGR